ncbi:MAG: ABC transporter substrate-binding protein [Gemmatimonadota bacterium]
MAIAAADIAPLRSAYESGYTRLAAELADSLYLTFREEPGPAAAQALWLSARLWEAVARPSSGPARFEDLLGIGDEGKLRREGARRLAAAKVAVAEEPEAIRILLENPEAEDGRRRELMRRAAARLSLAELESLAQGGSSSPAMLAIVQAEFARALALAGLADSAARVASAALAAAPDPEELRTARSVAAGRVSADRSTVHVGAILPLSGRFAAVGVLLLEGAELALAEHNRTPGRRRAELTTLDDNSRVDVAAQLLRALEAEGVAGILGPVRSEGLALAAGAREYKGLLIVSPTATDVGMPLPHAYTLWERSRRETEVAADLGRWIAGELGLRKLGVLYPASPGGDGKYRAFQAGVEAAGGGVLAAVAYDPDSTTFEGPITALAEREPEAVFVAADGPRTVLQLGPQLSFYGLRATILAGGPSWADPAVVRRLDPSFADYRIAATYVDRVSLETAWSSFQNLYEVTYRKPLPDNMFPALGYDATRLILEGVPAEGPVPPGSVARAASRRGPLAGATGELSPDPTTSTVGRRTLMRILRSRRLDPAEPADILAWAEEARRQEEARRELLQEMEERERATRRERGEGSP